MARNTEFYKGRRKKRNYALIPFVIVLGIAMLVVVAFYATQKYAIISKDGITIRLPLYDGEYVTDEGELVTDKVSLQQVDVEIQFDSPDYSRVEATAGENVEELRAIFVPAGEMTEENIKAYADRLNSGNALLLEMKPRSGQLMWESASTAARSYGLVSGQDIVRAMPRIVAELKERGIYLAAQISCCIDENYAGHSTTVALRTEYGAYFTDSSGTWLDPYNVDVRNYVVQMAQELYSMGFDEVVLADVMHPVVETKEGQEPMKFVYTRQMSTTPTPVNAVCGFAVYVAEALRDRSGLLSVYCNTRTALAKADEGNGQDAALFMKIYDRVYFPTDRYTYSFNVQDMQSSVKTGSVYDRLVPVVVNYLPDNSTWVYIEQPEE